MRILFVTQENSWEGNIYGGFISASIEQHTAMPVVDITLQAVQLADNGVFHIEVPDKKGLSAILWYRSLRTFILKNNIGKVVWANGYCLPKLSLPQIVLFGEIDFLRGKKKLKNWQIHSRKHIQHTFQTATALLTYSQQAKSFLQQWFAPGNIIVQLPIAETLFHSLSWEEKSGFREKETQGNQFFAATVNDDAAQATNLLKAFSIFKKWQKSSFHLVLLFPPYLDASHTTEKLQTYHYRHAVTVVPYKNTDELQSWIGAAYGLIHLSRKEENIFPLLQSIVTHTPGIFYSNPTIAEIIGDAAFLLQPGEDNIDALGHTLISMYKAENIYIGIKDKLELTAKELQIQQASNTWLKKYC